jgi:hypothetical protein
MAAQKRGLAAGMALLLASFAIPPVSALASPARSAPQLDPAYQHFLSKLQAALRANDRRTVVKLVNLPLRVNFTAGAELYRERQSVMRDFGRIFTDKVKQAVLRQRPKTLFVRDQGAMVGDGELWFRETCSNSACSHLGPVRVVAVNP